MTDAEKFQILQENDEILILKGITPITDSTDYLIEFYFQFYFQSRKRIGKNRKRISGFDPDQFPYYNERNQTRHSSSKSTWHIQQGITHNDS